MNPEQQALQDATFYKIEVRQGPSLTFYVYVDGKKYGTPYKTHAQAVAATFTVRHNLYLQHLNKIRNNQK